MEAQEPEYACRSTGHVLRALLEHSRIPVRGPRLREFHASLDILTPSSMSLRPPGRQHQADDLRRFRPVTTQGRTLYPFQCPILSFARSTYNMWAVCKFTNSTMDASWFTIAHRRGVWHMCSA
jgi:hypothetical protein